MLSGTGEVSREWTDRELGSWNELLPKWTDTNERPKQLTKLVQQGIPEALRGMVWQQLANVDKDDDLLNQYRILISQVKLIADDIILFGRVVSNNVVIVIFSTLFS